MIETSYALTLSHVAYYVASLLGIVWIVRTRNKIAKINTEMDN